MEYRPLSLDEFSEQLRRNVDPGAPVALRMMGARGLVPAAPDELASVLYQLSLDEDATIRDAAHKALTEAPDQILITAGGSPVNGQVLDLIAHTHGRNERVLEALFSNPATLDETFGVFAQTCSESISELIAINEVRMLRTPAIIEALYMNVNARMSTIDRLVDLAKRHGVKFQLPVLRELVSDPTYNTTEIAAQSAIAVETGADDSFKALLDAALEVEKEEPETSGRKKKKEEEEETATSSNISTKILTMSISEKVRMATLGSMSERDFLIKDNNRLVHMAALTSPKVQLKDIQSYSGNRLMPDGVLSFIAQHRRYRRIYAIVVSLVNNPKMPVKEGVRLMPQLVRKDLKALLKNRNISHNLRRRAQALDREREKKR
jgi:hypothetical protein